MTQGLNALPRRVFAEGLGTALLLVAIVGSGIMADKLSGGNAAVALLCNAIATGAALVVLITMLGPISGAHFNPAVTLIEALRQNLGMSDALAYIAVQTAGAIAGVVLAHAMFDLPFLQASDTVRTGPAQWLSEAIATFGLILTILLTMRHKPGFVPAGVGLYVVSAYWFTASTSFANPAVTLARAWTDTFTGIAPGDVIGFASAQLAGALAGWGAASVLGANET
jgi:glycerol uptake facilitator-like aquaporin